MTAEALAPMVARFRADGPPRVWSLVVTVLGDVAQAHGGAIGSARLQAMLAPLGVEPGAVRVAVSRLRGEGWIESEREGRGSIHRFGPRGLEEFDEVRERVYGAREETQAWSVTVGPEPPHFDAVELASQVWLSPGDHREWEFGPPAIALTGELELNGQLAPPPAEAQARQNVAADAGDARHLQDAGPFDAAIARLLLIHRWRRFVLRHPDLPPPVHDADLRELVGASYRALLPASRDWLETGEGALPTMTGAARERFL